METVYTDKAPKPIGPYSQAIIAQGFVFVSGQIGVDPKKGELAPGGIREETKQTLENIQAILEESGSGLDKVVKVEVYMADLGEFGEMNEIYNRYFPNNPPARVTVGVETLPKKARVEISVVALR